MWIYRKEIYQQIIRIKYKIKDWIRQQWKIN